MPFKGKDYGGADEARQKSEVLMCSASSVALFFCKNDGTTLKVTRKQNKKSMYSINQSSRLVKEQKKCKFTCRSTCLLAQYTCHDSPVYRRDSKCSL